MPWRRSSYLAIASGAAALAGALTTVGFASCIATGPDLTQIIKGTGGTGGGFIAQGSGSNGGSSSIDVGTTDPHGLIGAVPSHGPFSGGQRVLVRGNGFGSDIQVWFGDTLATDIVPVDATKVQVTAPPGAAGPVSLSTQNGDDTSTKRTLSAGYSYDAIYAVPSSGPTSGGTDVHILGQGTSWGSNTTAFIDLVACNTTTVLSPTELVCVAPQGTPGSKTIRVSTNADSIDAIDAFTYEDSTNGFKGGLSGSTLAGTMKVLVYSDYTGDPIPGASVIIGSETESALVQTVGPTGVVVFNDASLSGPKTVTVVAPCMDPTTFVDVPVDTVTVYLDPILSPICGSLGDPPGTGTKFGSGSTIQGEIVWPENAEFMKGAWKIPAPIGNEAIAAYVFSASSSPLTNFYLPSPGYATTPKSDGTIGYDFTFFTSPGDKTLYALAGIEDRSKNPPTFTAYTMGLVRGVPATPNQVTEDVYIRMQDTLDEALTITPKPPGSGPKGPDRLFANVALKLGTDGYAILPNVTKAPLLPFQGNLAFVGLPVLDHDLSGSTYFLSARAVTGLNYGPPESIVSSVQTNTTAFPMTIDGFVGVPTLKTPAANTQWDARHLSSTFASGSAPIDLIVYDVSAGNGIEDWTVVAPAKDLDVQLPDLEALTGLSLASGPVTISVTGGAIDSFDYGSLGYRQISTSGMRAYALDYFSSHLP